MRRSSALALVISVLTVGMAACGGDDEGGEKTFADPSFAVTFKYSDEFEPAGDVSTNFKAGGTAAGKSKGIRLDAKNGIVLQRYDLNTAVTEKNLEQIRPELEGVLRRLVGEVPPGKRLTAGGLPGYEYELDVPRPAGARSRLAVLFDGKREYTVNCQFTKSKRREIEAACQKALDTLEVK